MLVRKGGGHPSPFEGVQEGKAAMAEPVFENVKEKEKESPLAEQAAGQISRLIIERQLTHGDKLPNEFELAEQLNVGRGTVREAVKLLVARNVLEIRRGRGTYVTQQTGVVHDPLGFAYMPGQRRLARELMEIRLNLEPWAASLAARHADTEDVALLRRLCREIEDLIHAGEDHLPQDEALHIQIARCTRNRVLPKLLPVVAYSVRLSGALNDPGIYQETIETHRQIVDAIAAGDEEAAREAMYRHLSANLLACAPEENGPGAGS